MTFKTKKPYLDSLENRSLMSNYGPSMSSPTITVHAETAPVIGSHENISVTTPTGTLSSVTYKISGPGLAVKSQVWNTSTSSYVRTSGEIHDFTANPTVSDAFVFYWGETPGTYTVKVTSVYSDKNHTTFNATETFNVAKPTFQTFTINATLTTFSSKIKPGWIGFVQSGPIQFNATVTSPVPASVGFVQEETSVWAKITTSKTTIFTNPPNNVNVLDINGSNSSPYFQNYFAAIFPNTKTQIGNGKVGDSPAYFSKINDNDLLKSIEYHLSLVTYLDYQPIGGIHIAIAKANWSVGGKATYSGTIGGDIIAMNWTVNYDKPGAWQVQGVAFPAIVTWQNNWPAVQQQYTAVDLTLASYNKKDIFGHETNSRRT